ncbi:hypothetical protein J501_3878 [Acinetobacter baumannii 96512]|nr:hypothetical protein ABLAC_23410 [Acinetobacter baumannii LAC-4]EXF62129.1 hypothetical protein J565_3823 [Acinetobacter baumannii 1552818]EXG15360.1 hypothetical protein J707_4101 [Acinetobacter baumannii 470922]KCX27005.1 hypothetical protein J501_4206 [Acinetobacter baumannii 96512]KCX28229.1 hypothetical protein J501_3878 [Acinetobacter baumannii 96512]
MFYQRVCNSTDSGVFQNHYQDIGLHQKIGLLQRAYPF